MLKLKNEYRAIAGFALLFSVTSPIAAAQDGMRSMDQRPSGTEAHQSHEAGPSQQTPTYGADAQPGVSPAPLGPRNPPPTLDTNGDGIADAWDRDADGLPDAWDLDGDANPDALDNNGDGEPDIFRGGFAPEDMPLSDGPAPG